MVWVAEGLEQTKAVTLLGGAGYGGSGAGMALFKQLLTLLAGAVYGGSGAGSL